MKCRLNYSPASNFEGLAEMLTLYQCVGIVACPRERVCRKGRFNTHLTPRFSVAPFLVEQAWLNCRIMQDKPECLTVNYSNLLKYRFALSQIPCALGLWASELHCLIWGIWEKPNCLTLKKYPWLGVLREFQAVLFCSIQFLCWYLELEWTCKHVI